MLSGDRSKTPREVAWEAALTSRINVVYYQRLIRKLERCDLATRIVAALAASGAVVGFLKPWPDANTALAAVAAVFAVIGPLLRYPEQIKTSALMLSRHNADYQRLERLLEKHPNLDEYNNDLEQVMSQWYETEAMEAEKVRTPDDKLLSKCDADVRKELGIVDDNQASALATA